MDPTGLVQMTSDRRALCRHPCAQAGDGDLERTRGVLALEHDGDARLRNGMQAEAVDDSWVVEVEAWEHHTMDRTCRQGGPVQASGGRSPAQDSRRRMVVTGWSS